MMEATVERLQLENESLRHENARLQAAMDELSSKFGEPEEIVRAIRHGEVDALVVDEEGHERVYWLQRYDAIYRSVIEESLPYGMWLADVDGRLRYVSRAFLEMIDRSLEELQQSGFFHFLPAESRQAAERRWTECRASGTPFDLEYKLPLKDGSQRIIWTHGIQCRSYDGRLCWAGLNIDVTEREAMKDELRQKAEELQEAGRRKDEFLAVLGHELRNPLAAIHSGMHLLLLPDIDQGTARQVKEVMERQVHNLTRLVDDLLEVSRISSGKIQLQKEPVQLATMVQQAVQSVRRLLEDQRHELKVSLPPRPLHLEADPTRLEQILVNLLANAAKYTKPDGAIELSAERQGAEVVIHVRDNGVGIAADMLPKVFEPFTQAAQNNHSSQGGLGIGLMLVKRLVEMHGGTVEARSDGPGRGSEFAVRLPLLASPPEQPSGPHVQFSSRGKRLRVLVIDDSHDVASMLQLLLETWGHDVRAVHDGPAALDAFRDDQPDVVLLDLGLPEMDGYAVARQIRGEPAAKRPLIVAVSGYGQEEDKHRSHEAGCDFHLTKPIDQEQLESLIATTPPVTA